MLTCTSSMCRYPDVIFQRHRPALSDPLHLGCLYLASGQFDLAGDLCEQPAFGSGGAVTLTIAVLSIGKYRPRYRLLVVAPLFIADALMGIPTLVLNGSVLAIPGNLWSAILANAVRGFTCAMLLIAARLFRCNWKLDAAALVLGAGAIRTFSRSPRPGSGPRGRVGSL